MRRLAGVAIALGVLSTPAIGQHIDVEKYVLDNGMEFFLYPRTEQPNIISAGWVAKVGSVNERPGITGISHFFEHMMFKGTSTIGTDDAKQDADFRIRQKQVRDQLMALQHGLQYDRWREGEITDPWDQANDTEEMAELRAELRSLMEEHRDVIVKDEFDQIYTKEGASGMNAFTSHDLTFYFINVPSNKLELWAWMESDRLNDSVFREFYSERDVVHEERRLRTESTPTGIFDEQFDAMFWQSSPYSWPVIGWPSDLNSYTLEQAQEYFNVYYGSNNLVGVIVGDFDIEEAKDLIDEYFSRLRPSPYAKPAVVTLEMPQLAEKRMQAECDCQPQIEIRYHTVPFNHADEFPLQVLSEVLNGRTGRLYKAMVEGQEIASSASANQDSRRYGGAFSFYAETKGDSTPQQIEKAWDAEVQRIKTELVGERELQKVKNQLAADSYRRLESNFFLMLQIGYYEALGDWEYINTAPKRLDAVTAEDIQRVAKEYLNKTNSAVAIYTRKAGTGGEDMDPALAALAPQAQQMVKAQLRQLEQVTDPNDLQMILSNMEQARGQVPPEFQSAVEYMITKVRERLEAIESSEGGDS